MKHVYRYFLFHRNSGYDIFNSVIRWHPAVLETRLILEVLQYNSNGTCYDHFRSEVRRSRSQDRIFINSFFS